MNTMLERLGVPSARNVRYFAPGYSMGGAFAEPLRVNESGA